MENVELVKMDDFRKPDGNLDWTAYSKAEVANGERCDSCRSMLLHPTGRPRTCGSCRDLAEDDGEVSHDERVRCPACKHTWNPRDNEEYDLLEDGEHSTTCGECGHDFEVSTSISWTFQSPALVEKKPKE
jgi:hypothetical protein